MHTQDIIFSLQNFWGKQGCTIINAVDTEVGAATAHPATMLECLKRGTMNIAYLQPCRRPEDGRYANHPNRLQHYYQFQVVIKPYPYNIRQLFLSSLKYLGIDYRCNDIKFMDSDWSNPTLGAWGIGWEVLCNGMEITQFTYMHQIGGVNCTPTAVEIAYGVERLALQLQQKRNIADLTWDQNMKYGEIYSLQEKQFCQYYFDFSDTSMLLQQFDAFETQAISAIKHKLIFPAYNLCTKNIHIFNILNARQKLSNIEREAYITRIRNIVNLCCKEYQLL